MAVAVLAARHDAGGGLARVDLVVPDEVAKSYVAPGQYIVVTTASGEGYFVLGGAVGAMTWELLVRQAGGAADELLAAPLGTSFDVSAALGAGFPVAAAAHRPLVVAVVASALGMARPIMALRIGAGLSASTYLLVGLRAPTDLPLADEVTTWCAQGLRVVLCLSRTELVHHREVLPLARRASGYVQAVLGRAVAAGEVPAGALLVAAGPAGMLDDLRGLADFEVLTNV